MIKSEAIIADMQKDIWVMEARRLTSLFTLIHETKISIPEDVAVLQQSKISISGDTAVIPVKGILLKKIPSIYRWFGIEMTSYIDIQNMLAEAVNDSDVKKIILDIDSPGGKVAGVQETAEAIAAAGRIKTVVSRAEDLVASGAYWLASQAQKIEVGPNAEVGSIGVFTVYVDYSQRAEKEGIKVHVIKSGEHKGMGVIGSEITEEQIGAIQKVINGIADNFIKAVSNGRDMKIESVREIADGRIFLAADAKKLKLVDSLISKNRNVKSKEKVMTQTNQTNAESEIQQVTVDLETVRNEANEEEKNRLSALEQAFPDEPDFVIKQFKAGASVEESQPAYNAILKGRLEESKKQNAALEKEKAEQAEADPILAGGTGSEQASDFMEASKLLARERKISRTEAQKIIKKERPELYEQYLNECNQMQHQVK